MTTLVTRPELPPTVHLDAVQTHHRAQVLQKMRDGRYTTEEVPACLCGSVDSELVRIGDRFGIPVGMAICEDCGLLRTTPRLSTEALPAFYEEDYHGLHMGAPRPLQALYREGQGALIFDKVATHLDAKDELTVFEIGCGAGTVLLELKDAAERFGVRVRLVGCDYAAAYVEGGRQRDIDIRHGGISSLMGAGTPDLIILSHVVEHFVDMAAEMEAVAALCSDNTIVYIEVPGVMSIHKNKVYDYRLTQYFTLAHIFHFTRATLTGTLRRAGFHCLSADEHVSAVFRKGITDSPVEPNVYTPTLSYLRNLESPRARARRFILQARRWVRRASSGLVRRVAGEKGIVTAKHLEACLRTAGRLVRR